MTRLNAAMRQIVRAHLSAAMKNGQVAVISHKKDFHIVAL